MGIAVYRSVDCLHQENHHNILTIMQMAYVKPISYPTAATFINSEYAALVIIGDGDVQDRADALFKQVNMSKTLKGRSNDGIASACLYIACRQESVPRTFKGLTLS